MKKKKFNILFACLPALTLSGVSFAHEGGAGTHGGDVAYARKIQLARDFSTLKVDVARIVENMNLDAISNPEVRALLSKLLGSGLRDDISRSPYEIAERCRDEKGIAHDGATTLGERNAKICFDLGKMSGASVQKGELIGLAVHEHAHHLGISDTPVSVDLIGEIARISGYSYGRPSDKAVYRNYETGVVVFADVASPSIFWYVPAFKMDAAVSLGRDSLTGIESFRFRMTPHLPASIRAELLREFGSLRPSFRVLETKVSRFTLPDLDLSVTLEPAKLRQLDQPMSFEISMLPDQAKLFALYAKESGGAYGELTLGYASTTTQKYFRWSTTCGEIAEALSSRQPKTHAWSILQIQAAVSEILLRTATLDGDRPEANQRANASIGAVVRSCFSASNDGRFAVDPAKARTAISKTSTLTDEGSVLVLETRVKGIH